MNSNIFDDTISQKTMDRICLTGSSGFIGSCILNSLSTLYEIEPYYRDSPIQINHKTVIHLAGIAHDLKNTTDPDAYYQANTELTKEVFDAFLASDAKVFIFFSSIKAVSDSSQGFVTELSTPNPITHYGKSKRLAEEYILSKPLSEGKRVYIMRPTMIHGPGNKGNLNLLFNFVAKGIPWPLASFDNKRSFCCIDNVIYVLRQLMDREDIPSGIYNLCDTDPLSTTEVVQLMADTLNIRLSIWKLPQGLINIIAQLGNLLQLPLNTERLQKLTDSFVVSNSKLVTALGRPLPFTSEVGLFVTFRSFSRSQNS